MMLRECAHEHGLNVVGEYIDDGWSGTNFDRPEFQRMIDDIVDTLNGDNELAPFLNILNEMHARQTSKKVKAAFRTRFTNGAHYGAYAPLGYRKDPEQTGQGLGQSSMHYIRYDVLYGYVFSRLQYWSEQVHRDDEKLLLQLLNAGNRRGGSP